MLDQTGIFRPSLNPGAARLAMDYEKIRHAAKTGDKILELAVSIGLDPARHTIQELADRLLAKALAESGADAPCGK